MLFRSASANVTEIYVMDSAGTATQISPHATDSPGWTDDTNSLPVILHHKNLYSGVNEWIHLSKLARAVEKLTGETLIYSDPIPSKDCRVWATDQDTMQSKYDANRAEAIVEYNKPLYDETGTNIISLVNTNVIIPPIADVRQPLPKVLQPKEVSVEPK